MISFDRLAYTERMRDEFAHAQTSLERQGKTCVPACVVSLDRSFPLLCAAEFDARAELATSIKKSEDSIVAVGDWVAAHRPPGHEKALIEAVLPRRNEIARVKRVGREGQLRRQVLAANVDDVLICQSLTGEGIDEPLLIRQMVAVAGCKAKPIFVLTKKDLVSKETVARACARIALVAPEVPLHVVSVENEASIDGLRAEFERYTTALLLGESGVGKSSLVNALMGEEMAQTGHVRSSDDKGRHTTVARRMIALPGNGIIIDAPGLRTLQIIDMASSLKRAFPDIADAALGCRFRDCTHGDEPGCAVRDSIPAERLKAFRQLHLSERR